MTMKYVVCFSGRFQPFHKGHYQTYLHICSKFGKDNVYICTSNKTLLKSPFNFLLKKHIITTMFGVPANKIIKIKNPYKPLLLLNKVSEDYALVVVVDSKDLSRLGGKYFIKYNGTIDKPYTLNGYVYVYTNPNKMNIDGKLLSGSVVRLIFKNSKYSLDDKKKLFLKLYGKFNQNIFLLITTKLAGKYINLSTLNKIIDLILKLFYPIVYSQFRQLQQLSEVTALHYTNLAGLSKLKGLEGSKKPICCTKKISYNKFTTGIATSGGIVTLIKGLPLFYSLSDAYTLTDSSGRRWVSFLQMLNKCCNKIINDLLLKYRKSLESFIRKYDTNNKRLIFMIVSDIMKLDSKKQKLFIQSYFNEVQIPFFSKHKNLLLQVFKHISSNNYSDLDLLLLVKTKVKKIGIDSSKPQLVLAKWLILKQYPSIKTELISNQTSLLHFARLMSLSKSYLKELKQLLLCGGAAGHMTHVFLDLSLTFNDFRTIINRCLTGKLNFLGLVKLKTDGQNLMISFKNNKLIAARNKGNLKNFGLNALDKLAIKKMFAGRGHIEDAFYYAMFDLLNTFRKLNAKQITDLFLNGKNWINLLIIYPLTTNVIPYDKNLIILHNLTSVDLSGLKIGSDRKPINYIVDAINKINANIQKKFTIDKMPNILLPRSTNFTLRRSYYINKLNAIQTKYKLSGNANLLTYVTKYFLTYIVLQASKLNFSVPTLLLKMLCDRWVLGIKAVKITDLVKKTLNLLFNNWIKAFDKEDHTRLFKEAIWPIESLYLLLGMLIIRNISTLLAANPDSAVQKIRKLLDANILKINNSNDKSIIDKLRYQLNKLNSIGGLDSVIPTLGIVFQYKGKTYKLTGSFASVNNILGMIKYTK